MNDRTSPVRVPGFRVVRQLGRGGMASVYLAVQESLDREVALKIMAPNLLALDDDFSARFVNEGRTIAKLNHPNVVTVYDTAVAESHHYIAMEYIDGENLKSRMQRGLSTDDGVQIIKQVAGALGYAHKKGFVHRDVKPDNILIREDGTAVLTDFGIAKATGGITRMTATGMSIGTPHYMSPEQIRGGNVDPRADLYSLGVVFYEVLTDRPPFDATDSFALGMKHINDPVPRLPESLVRYQPILDRLLAKGPEQRYPDAEALSKALDVVQTSTGSPETAVVTTEILPVRKGSAALNRAWIWGGLAIIAVLVSGAAFLYMGPGSSSLPVEKKEVANQPVRETPPPAPDNSAEIAETLKAARNFLTDEKFDTARAMLDEARALGARGEELAGLERRLQELRTRRSLATELLAKAKTALDANRLSEAKGHCESAKEFFSSLGDENVCNEVEQRRAEVKKQWQQQNVGSQGTKQVR